MGLPPSPAMVTAPLGFEDAAVLGFFIYKYRISSSSFTHLSLTQLHRETPLPITFKFFSFSHHLLKLFYYKYFLGSLDIRETC